MNNIFGNRNISENPANILEVINLKLIKDFNVHGFPIKIRCGIRSWNYILDSTRVIFSIQTGKEKLK